MGASNEVELSHVCSSNLVVLPQNANAYRKTISSRGPPRRALEELLCDMRPRREAPTHEFRHAQGPRIQNMAPNSHMHRPKRPN